MDQPFKKNLMVKTEPQSVSENADNVGNTTKNKRRVDTLAGDATTKRQRIEEIDQEDAVTNNNSNLNTNNSTNDIAAEEIEVCPDISFEPRFEHVSNYHFLMSLLPFMNKLDPLSNFNIRTKVYRILFKEVMDCINSL